MRWFLGQSVATANGKVIRVKDAACDLFRHWLMGWILLTFLLPIEFILSVQEVKAHPFARTPPMPADMQCPAPAPPMPGSGSSGATCTSSSCNSGCSTCDLSPPIGSSAPGVTSQHPMSLLMGIPMESPIDFSLSAAGISWKLDRTRMIAGKNNGGVHMQGKQWAGGAIDSYLYQTGPGYADVALLTGNGVVRYFKASGGVFIAPTDSYLQLTHDAGNQQYILTDQVKNLRWTFNDFTLSNTSLYGTLKEQTTLELVAQGKSGFVYTYNTAGTLIQITSPTGQDYNIIFTWNAYLVKRVQIQDSLTNLIAQIDYTYFQDVTSASSDIGNVDHLVQVKIARKSPNDSAGTLSIVRYTQYRNTTVGTEQLKAVYEHDAVQRIVSSVSGISTPEDILTKADNYGTPQIQDFASRSFTYYTVDTPTNSINTPFQANENLEATYGANDFGEIWRVKSETIGGCGSCGRANSITKYYFYLRVLARSLVDQNQVSQIVIEDTVDSAGNPVYRTVYGLEGNGQIDPVSGGRLLRRAIIQDPVTSPKYWCESWTYATSTGATALPFRVAEHRYPSAHAGVTTASTFRSFLSPYDGSSWTNDSSTLSTSSGLIETFSYNSAGLQTDAWVKNGSGGTAYYVSAADYGDGTNPTLLIAEYDYPTQTTTRSNGKQTSYSYTFYDSSTHRQIKTKTTTLPTIPTSQNGSGVATTKSEYFDNLGRLCWTQDGEGYINYYAYDPSMGLSAYSAVDVDPSNVSSDISSGSAGNWDSWTARGASTNKPTRSGSLPTPLALATKNYYDAQGRGTKTTDTGGADHYTVYENLRTISFRYWDSTNSKCLVPIQVSLLNSNVQKSEDISIRASYTGISTVSGVPTGFSTNPSQSDYVSWTRYTYDSLTGYPSYTDRYARIPSSGTGTLSADFYRTIQQYDLMGRPQYQIEIIKGSATSNSVEQVTRYTYDVRDRVTQVDKGVSGDTAANSHDMGSNYNLYPTLRTISQTVYDSGGIGDGFVTKDRVYFGTGSTDYTGANYYRTYRGALRGIEPFYVSSSTETPIGPYSVKDVDWLGRTTTASAFDTAPTWSTVLTGDGYSAYASSTTTNRRTQVDSLYDDLGRMYQAKKFKIAATTGTGTNYLSRKNYFDRNGQLVAAGIEYAKGTEIAYDGAGRPYQHRTVIALKSTPFTSGAFNYNAPLPKPNLGSMSGGDAGVLALSHRALDANGNETEIDSFEDNHDDLIGSSKGINLTNNNDYVRRTVFNWFDPAHRLTTSADFGSGDTGPGAGQWKYAALPTRPSTTPTASSSTALVSRATFNADSGLPDTQIDPSGTISKQFYDHLGRKVYLAANFSDFNAGTESGTGDSTDPSKDQVTKWIYDGPSRLKQLVAMDPNADGNLGDNQITTYLYENSVEASRRTNEIYPDSADTTSAGADQIKIGYNVDGSLSQRTDQRGTVIDYSYANTRLPAIQSVSTVGSGVDGSVRSIGRTYDNLRRLQKITSYASTAGSGTVVNEVQFVPDEMDQNTATYQSHSGTVNMSTTPTILYNYNNNLTGSVYNKQYRMQFTTYPNGRVIYRDFGTAGNPYDVLNQVRFIYETNTLGTLLAQYDYNGAGSTLASLTLPEPSLKLDYFQGTAGTYAGRDRFGRVIDHYWKGFGTTADADRFRYGYDYSGHRIYTDIDAAIYSTNDKDETYSLDGLHRLTAEQTGTLSGATISGTPATEEAFTLDALRNWTSYVKKASGTISLNQARIVNSANEVTGISASAGTNWATPAYDPAGNMTTIPKSSAPTTTYTATYDAWNRLVKLVDASTSQTVQQNQYDGRNFRTIIQSFTSGTLSETRHSYFTDDWRCVEERVGAATTADRQFVWGDRYIDELILRDRGSERLYALQDAIWNVTSIVNASGLSQERYTTSGFGNPTFLTGSFGARSGSSFDWETLLGGYRYDGGTRFFIVRNRVYNSLLGNWVQRDPLDYIDGLNAYAPYFIPDYVDPSGTLVTCVAVGFSFVFGIGGGLSRYNCRDNCGNTATINVTSARVGFGITLLGGDVEISSGTLQNYINGTSVDVDISVGIFSGGGHVGLGGGGSGVHGGGGISVGPITAGYNMGDVVSSDLSHPCPPPRLVGGSGGTNQCFSGPGSR